MGPKKIEFLVVADGKVTGVYTSVEGAKEVLNEYPRGASSPSRMVVQINDGVVSADPHTVGGQGSGMSAGFNKWWWDWGDIQKMTKVAQAYVNDKHFFLVVADGKVTGRYDTVDEAKEQLNAYPPAANKPSRMVAEFKNGAIVDDPHTVGGQAQGSGVAAGFNKWLWNWNDIKKMIAVANDYVRDPEVFLVVADGKVVGQYETIEEVKNALNKYPAEASSPSRMAVEVNVGVVQTDPHVLGSQAFGVATGFNKWWWDWGDIKQMIKVAEEFLLNRDQK